MDKKVSTQIFLDSADPQDSKKADEILKKAGFVGIEGQTTNPSLVAKQYKKTNQNHDLRISNYEEKLKNFYKYNVQEINKIIKGPISIQVIANNNTSVDDLLTQARQRLTWIPNSVIKFPCIANGLKAAKIFCMEGPVNMTLVFTEEQAAAVYSATKNAKFPVYISPFVGRLDDIGQNGMDLTKNILKLYKTSPTCHVKVITASVRTLDHLLYAIVLGSDIVSMPLKVLEEWKLTGFQIPDSEFVYKSLNYSEILYQDLSLDHDFSEYNIFHQLTDSGVAKFQSDWENINNIRKI